MSTGLDQDLDEYLEQYRNAAKRKERRRRRLREESRRQLRLLENEPRPVLIDSRRNLVKAHLDIAHEGNIRDDDDTTRMQFDPESTAQLMSLMTDMYADPALACVREYSTNAYDSHVQAGNPGPIHVTLPNDLNPALVIEDFGVGLSRSDIETIYSMYGKSTKRDSDDFNGILGIGCKAALAYTSSFTMVAHKDERRTVALITRESDGAGTIQIMDESDAPGKLNGVRIEIPSRDNYRMQSAADRYFKFWEPGTVLVNGRPPKSIWDDEDSEIQIRLDDDVIWMKNEYTDYVLMGNVAYPIDTGKSNGRRLNPMQKTFTSGKNAEGGIVVRVPIGEVSFAPSREQLLYNKRTLGLIDLAQEWVRGALLIMAQQDVEKAPTPGQAARRAQTWWKLFTTRPVFFYRGRDISDIIQFDKDTTFLYAVGAYGHNLREYGNKIGYLRLEDLDKNGKPYLHVTGNTAVVLGGAFKQKLNVYLDEQYNEHDKTYAGVLVYKEALDTFWFDDIDTVTIDFIKAIELPRDPQKIRDAGTWKYYDSHGDEHRTSDLAKNTHYNVWMAGSPANAMERDTLRQLWNLAKLSKKRDGRKLRLLIVPIRSVNKFMAENSDCPSVGQYVIECLRNFDAGATSYDVLWRLRGQHLLRDAGMWGLQADTVHDPEFADYLRKMDAASKVEGEYHTSAYHFINSAFASLVDVLPGLADALAMRTSPDKALAVHDMLCVRYPYLNCTINHTILGRIATAQGKDYFNVLEQEKIEKRFVPEYVNSLYAYRQAMKIKQASRFQFTASV